MFCLCEGLLSVSAVFQSCWIDRGSDLASENSINPSTVAGLNSRDGVCFADVSTISDGVPCVGHFRVRADGDSIMEAFKNSEYRMCWCHQVVVTQQQG